MKYVGSAALAQLVSLIKAALNGKAGSDHTHAVATASANGFLSAADKAKLDGIAAGAGASYTLPTASASVLGGIKVGSNLTISSGVLSATNTTYSAATASAAGLMAAADKAKLNGITAGANTVKESKTVTLTVAGWSDLMQTVSVSGVTASNIVIVAPSPDDQADYSDAGCYCSDQSSGALTFTCATKPVTALLINVLILN